MPKTRVPRIKPVENYTKMPDAEVVNRSLAVCTGLDGNSNFTNLPVALKDFKAGIDSVSALMAAALDGSKKVAAEKDKQRHALSGAVMAHAKQPVSGVEEADGESRAGLRRFVPILNLLKLFSTMCPSWIVFT